MINLKKVGRKVILKKEEKYSINDSVKNFRKEYYSRDDFITEFMKGPYFHQEYFRGPWTWGCSWGLGSLLGLLLIPLLEPMSSFLENIFGMDLAIAVIFSCVWGMFFLGIGIHFLATWIRRTFRL